MASKTTLTWVNGTWGAIVTNTTQVVQGEEAFPSGVKQNLQLQRQLSFGEVSPFALWFRLEGPEFECGRLLAVSITLSRVRLPEPGYVSDMACVLVGCSLWAQQVYFQRVH